MRVSAAAMLVKSNEVVSKVEIRRVALCFMTHSMKA